MEVGIQSSRTSNPNGGVAGVSTFRRLCAGSSVVSAPTGSIGVLGNVELNGREIARGLGRNSEVVRRSGVLSPTPTGGPSLAGLAALHAVAARALLEEGTAGVGGTEEAAEL